MGARFLYRGELREGMFHHHVPQNLLNQFAEYLYHSNQIALAVNDSIDLSEIDDSLVNIEKLEKEREYDFAACEKAAADGRMRSPVYDDSAYSKLRQEVRARTEARLCAEIPKVRLVQVYLKAFTDGFAEILGRSELQCDGYNFPINVTPFTLAAFVTILQRTLSEGKMSSLVDSCGLIPWCLNAGKGGKSTPVSPSVRTALASSAPAEVFFRRIDKRNVFIFLSNLMLAKYLANLGIGHVNSFVNLKLFKDSVAKALTILVGNPAENWIVWASGNLTAGPLSGLGNRVGASGDPREYYRLQPTTGVGRAVSEKDRRRGSDPKCHFDVALAKWVHSDSLVSDFRSCPPTAAAAAGAGFSPSPCAAAVAAETTPIPPKFLAPKRARGLTEAALQEYDEKLYVLFEPLDAFARCAHEVMWRGRAVRADYRMSLVFRARSAFGTSSLACGSPSVTPVSAFDFSGSDLGDPGFGPAGGTWGLVKHQ